MRVGFWNLDFILNRARPVDGDRFGFALELERRQAVKLKPRLRGLVSQCVAQGIVQSSHSRAHILILRAQ